MSSGHRAWNGRIGPKWQSSSADGGPAEVSHFSPDWLSLRQPADRSARNPSLLGDVAAWCDGRHSLAVIDLGSGTGSSLRACAATLPARSQRWALVDSDPALLSEARQQLLAWADRSTSKGDALGIEKAGRTIEVSFRHENLSAGLDALADAPADLIVASALFDLVSERWISSFVAALSARRLPLYAALTYDGDEQWSPPHAHDALVHRAFLQHQRCDKGFGPATGPDATSILAAALAQAGYIVCVANSPWQLHATDALLIEQLADGIADAASEAAPTSRGEIEEWRRFRRSAASSADSHVTVGHQDLWATPQGRGRSDKGRMTRDE